MSEDPKELTPIDLTAEPKAYVFVQPGWGERLAELAPRERDAAMDYESPLIDGITDLEEIRRRITGDMPPPVPTPPGGWTPENIGPEIRRLTEASRPIVVRAPMNRCTVLPVDAEYCNVCENFPCLGNHTPDVIAEALEGYERAAALIRQGWVTRAELEPEVLGYGARRIYFSPFRNSLVIREGFAMERRAAEEQDRREWIEGVRRRLGLVAEVHRCHVERSACGPQWAWSCARSGCGEFRVYRPTQAAAFAEALAHARSFVPQPPEEEPFPQLDWAAYMALADAVPVVRECADTFESRYRQEWKP